LVYFLWYRLINEVKETINGKVGNVEEAKRELEAEIKREERCTDFTFDDFSHRLSLSRPSPIERKRDRRDMETLKLEVVSLTLKKINKLLHSFKFTLTCRYCKVPL